jgi:glyceraldehyde 3-phosphate dehydrogenase
MATLKVGINGFGRIGRLVTRILLQRSNVEIVKINDLTDNETLAHLFKYDSAHGKYKGTVAHNEQTLILEGKKIIASSVMNPTELAWGAVGCDVVIECTGKFTDGDKARQHLQAGAKRVLISAPGKGNVDATIVLGVNDSLLSPEHKIISNASCTTNCLAPMVKVLDDAFGIETGFMNTIHAYTADQRLQDAPHKDLRRARAAAANIVPTTTGAAKAVGLVMPHLNGKLDGISMRVPTIDGSITDFTAVLKKSATVQDINNAMKQASETNLKGILEYCEEPIVSSDIIGNPHSCIFDALTTASQGTLVKVMGWYDNEYGYSCRIADLVEKIGQLG